MKKIFNISMITVCLIIGSVQAQAIDIPFGGDAMSSQLQNSKHTVAARFLKREKNVMVFEQLEALRGAGNVPKTFQVLSGSSYLRELELSADKTYLLFLNGGKSDRERDIPGRDPVFRLGTSIYSIHEIDAKDLKDLKRGVLAYSASIGNRVALKKAALDQIKTDVPYLQYSAAVDLTSPNMITTNEVDGLVDQMKNGQLKDYRARTIIINHVGKLKLVKHADFLEETIKASSEPNRIKHASVTALIKMNERQRLDRLAPVLEQIKSPKMDRRIIQGIR